MDQFVEVTPPEDGGSPARATIDGLRRRPDWPWRMRPGAGNAITDVPGVTVGHSGIYDPDRGACTGVTVVDPGPGTSSRPLPAAVHVINGYGKSAGLMQIEELGELESPIALTGVFAVPSVLGALTARLMEQDPEIGGERGGRSVNAVVLECNDGYLNDPRVAIPGAEHLAAAFATAGRGAAEGPVGAGSGMKTFGFPGGIGTSSRVLPAAAHHVGVLVLSNFGRREELLIAGRPVGRLLAEEEASDAEAAAEESEPGVDGSIIIVLATDLPVSPLQLKRMARRAQNGLARTGCSTADGSGEVVLAFTTARRDEPGYRELPREELQPAFTAVAECVEEAVLSSLFHGEPRRGRASRALAPFPVSSLAPLLGPPLG